MRYTDKLFKKFEEEVAGTLSSWRSRALSAERGKWLADLKAIELEKQLSLYQVTEDAYETVTAAEALREGWSEFKGLKEANHQLRKRVGQLERQIADMEKG